MIYENNNQSQIDSREILTFQEVMLMIGLKKSAMYELIKKPDGPKFTRVGGKMIITKRALLQWVDDNAGMKI